MRYRDIYPRHKKYQFGIIYNSFSWCRKLQTFNMIEIANKILIIETYFYMIQKRINSDLFAVEILGISFTWFRHERHTY